jgi:endonuclease YncB( thermonuclease family)
MRLHMNAADVRRLVTHYFLDLGVDSVDVDDIQENIRIDRGRCVARCYRVAEMFAMWMIDVGVLQFYDADGEMLHTVNLFTELQPQRAAA